MSNRSVSGWLIAIVFLGVLVGIVGGAVTGAIAGYYVVVSRAPLVAEPAAEQIAAPNPAPSQAPAATSITLESNSAVIDTVKKVEPAVVTVVNTLDHPGGGFGSILPTSSGSGVIVDGEGHIITNNHVVEGARTLQVIYQDGSKATADVVGTDPVSDLAVIQVKGQVPAAVPLGDSSSLQLGETVIAIGSPLGNYRGSVTVGVVSGLNRSVEGAQQEGLIQTDAAINHGNSGGPLINLAGQVIGINTLVVRTVSSGDLAEGLGFSIPSNTVQDVSQALITKGRVEYPYIGISYQQVTPQSASEFDLASKEGIVVQAITPGSPAAQAALQPGDIILAIGDSKLDENHTLRSVLFKYKPGDKVQLQIMRDGKTFSVTITLVPRPIS
ncbi:MAG: S1C family serine protease [Rudaea sp.]